MSDEARVMTVGDLLHALKDCDPNLLVVLDINREEDGEYPVETFIPTDAEMMRRNGRQTYFGDRDLLRISFKEDEP